MSDNNNDTESETSTLFDINDYFFNDGNLDYCYLTKEETNQFMAPSQHAWKDCHPKDHPAYVTIDTSKDEQWSLAKKEIHHVNKQMRALMNIDADAGENNIIRKVVLHIIGSESRIGQFFMKNLCLSEISYLKFMHTICLQAAYDCSSTQLYLPYSKLRKFCLMEEKEYNAVWSWMANLRKLDSASISTSRREVPLWETLQSICNQILCSIL